ncbi:FecR family protein [Nafulsella turpanensis]|uniref:FecR family protein n=1 Tax=Nafulsella turpanensis TaxID=1265690 RepID=UPI00034B576A|nr:FecR domain-containing protein [Nafulsella turpanensis]
MNTKFWEITAKQLEGKASPSELEALQQWLAEDPAHQKQYQEQKRLWVLTSPPPPAKIDTQTAWEKVRKTIRPEQQKIKQRPLWPLTARIAASVALLIGLAWLVQLLFFPYYSMEVVASGNEQKMFLLPDSSQVWLNKHSRLIYQPDFEGAERAVILEGEAFFEVKHDPEKPFTVETAEALTTVLGTSFNLRAYPEEETVELRVATGKVAFAAEEEQAQALVPAGYAAILQKPVNTISKFRNLSENAWAWKSGSLTFKGESLAEVALVLERYYGVNLRLQNPQLANCRFTGSFQEPALKEVLQVLATALQLEYTRQNEQTYTLTGQGCNK